MRRVVLTKGLFALIDDDDVDRVYAHMWSVHTPRKDASSTNYAKACINGKMVSMHRFILNVTTGQVVDHINGDGLDNRKENLRIVTPNQNQHNRKPNAGRQYKGITFVEKLNKWRAGIKIDGKRKHLGCFVTAEEAAKAYDCAARKHRGHFAKLNFEHDDGR